MTQVFLAFLRLGCISFGGPAVHLAMFRTEFVQKRRWLTDEIFGQCIAITQILPGPGSSQTGMLIGYLRGGPRGMLAAWIGFTFPSALLMTAFALNAALWSAQSGWVRGVLCAAAGVVAYAVLSMRRTLVHTPLQLALLFVTFAAVLASPLTQTGPLAIAACALFGALVMPAAPRPQTPLDLGFSRRSGTIAAVLFLAALAALTFAAQTRIPQVVLAAAMFQTGSLVFGGGHVVLPLLQTQVVREGIATSQQLLGAYAAAQLVPGPLFTISSYVGAVAFAGALGIAGALIATLAIFAPSFFLLVAVIPYYDAFSRNARFAAALAGANAAVVGLLAAAFVTPVWTNAVHDWRQGLLALAAFAALVFWKRPAWQVVGACALAGAGVLR